MGQHLFGSLRPGCPPPAAGPAPPSTCTSSVALFRSCRTCQVRAQHATPAALACARTWSGRGAACAARHLCPQPHLQGAWSMEGIVTHWEGGGAWMEPLCPGASVRPPPTDLRSASTRPAAGPGLLLVGDPLAAPPPAVALRCPGAGGARPALARARGGLQAWRHRPHTTVYSD